LSYGLITQQRPDGTLYNYYGVSTISAGTSYIKYLKFANSTTAITPGYDYQSGAEMSSLT
jgi:hypothetical protein